jgi:hypothetical protein
LWLQVVRSKRCPCQDITLPEIEEVEDMVSIEEAEDMVSLRRNVTGVDATVFVSTKGYGPHAPACI